MLKKLLNSKVNMKFFALLLSLGMLVSVISVQGAEGATQSNVLSEVSQEESLITLPEQASGGNILHAWNMSFNEIRNQLPYIAAAGFNTIQTSPIGDSLFRFPNYDNFGNPTSATERSRVGTWWMLYQPVSFNIGNMLGTEEEFRALCAEAAGLGISIIVDAVPNHTTSWWNEIHESLRRPELFHSVPGDGSPWDKNIDQWNNRWDSRRSRLLGLMDFYTGNPEFQNLYMDFLGDIIDAGASGFRYDAMVHIELPYPWDVEGLASDFWPVIQNFVDNRVEYQGRVPFQYGEILHRWHADYIAALPGMGVTACGYGYHIRNNVIQGNLGNWNTRDFFVAGGTPDRFVTWVESHDHYGNAGISRNITDAQMRVGWAIMTAREGTTPLFLVRPGPGFVNDGQMFHPNDDGTYTNVWGHSDFWRDPTITAVNWFANYFVDEPEHTSTHFNQVALIERGPGNATTGVTIVNSGTQTRDVDFPVQMVDGKYICQVTGEIYVVSNGRITGPAILGRSVLVIYLTELLNPSPRVEAVPGSTRFYDDGIEVTLTAVQTTEQTYTLTGPAGVIATDVPFQNGDTILVGLGAQPGDEFRLTLTGRHDNLDTDYVRTFVYTKGDPAGRIRIEFAGVDWPWVRIWGWHPGGGNIFQADWYNAPLMDWCDEVDAWVFYLDTSIVPPFNIMFHSRQAGQGPQLPTGPPYWLIHGSTRIEMVDGRPVMTPIGDTPIVYATPGSSNFFTDEGITVTLNAFNTISRHLTIDGPGGSHFTETFEHGQQRVIGAGAQPGDVFTLTLTGQNATGTVTQTFTYIRVDRQPIRVEFVPPTVWPDAQIWGWWPGGGDIFAPLVWDTAPSMDWCDEASAWVFYIGPEIAPPFHIMFRNSTTGQFGGGGTFGLITGNVRIEQINGVWTTTHFRNVSFDATTNGGALENLEDGVRSVAEGSPVGTLPQVAPRDGYDFEGWFTQVSGGELVTADQVIMEDVTFFAQWTEIIEPCPPVRIEFAGVDWQLVRIWGWWPGGGNIFAPLEWGTAPLMEWCDDVAAWVFYIDHPDIHTPFHIMFHNGADSQVGGYVFGLITGDTRIELIDGVWVVESIVPSQDITVTFDPTGGTVAKTYRVVTTGETFGGAFPMPTRPGYVFRGWFTEVEDGTRIVGTQNVTQNADFTLFARWTWAGDIEITFNPNGGTVREESRIVTAGAENFGGAFLRPTRPGYIFEGWFTAVSGGTRVVGTGRVTFTTNTTLFARWRAENSIVVTFNPNGGTVAEASREVRTDETFGGAFQRPFRTGYVFEGWFTEPDGGIRIVGTQKVTQTSNFTLYARWRASNTIVVTFDPTGGTVNPTNRIVTVDDTFGGAFPMPRRDGHTFEGWFTAVDGGTRIVGTNRVTQTSDFTLFARWRADNAGFTTIETQ